MTAIRFTVFRFVIQRFGRLRGLRFLTQAFDAGLGALTLVTAPSVYSAIGNARREIKSWPDVTESAHQLGGHQFNWRGNELGHIHSNGVADVRLNATEQADVLSKHLAQRHHVAPNSTWVSYFIERGNQVQPVVNLFRIPFQRMKMPASEIAEPPSEEYVQ